MHLGRDFSMDPATEHNYDVHAHTFSWYVSTCIHSYIHSYTYMHKYMHACLHTPIVCLLPCLHASLASDNEALIQDMLEEFAKAF